MPARNDPGAAEQLRAAGVSGAEHCGLSAGQYARHSRAQSPESEVPRRRLPRPSATTAEHTRGTDVAHQFAGQPQCAADDGRGRDDRRSPEARRRRDQRVTVQRPRARAGGTQLARGGVTRLGGTGSRTTRGRREGRRCRRWRDHEGLRHVDPQSRRHAITHRRSGAGAALGGVRTPESASVHPHRRPCGVLSADRLHERALARTVAVRRSPVPV